LVGVPRPIGEVIMTLRELDKRCRTTARQMRHHTEKQPARHGLGHVVATTVSSPLLPIRPQLRLHGVPILHHPHDSSLDMRVVEMKATEATNIGQLMKGQRKTRQLEGSLTASRCTRGFRDRSSRRKSLIRTMLRGPIPRTG
jgi:hypothetical protein